MQRGRIAKSSQVSLKAKLFNPVDIADHVVIYGTCEVGAFSYINVGSILYSNAHVGSFCSIGRGVHIGLAKHPPHFLSTHPFQFSSALFPRVEGYADLQNSKWTFHAKTEIGSDVWIGANALITSGIIVGHGAIIGAGAVVTKDVLPYQIVGGIPAREIRFRFSEENIEKLLKIKWWNWDINSLLNVPFDDVERAISDMEARLESGRVSFRGSEFKV